MHPILCNIGPFQIHSYGMLLAVGFLLGIAVSLYFAKREGLPSEVILDLAIYVIIASVVGARLFYVAGQWDQYQNNLLEIFMVQKGGLVFLGGLLAAILVVFWYAKLKSIPVLKLLDVITPGTAIGYAIGRLGCFFNGCCFGLPTGLPWGVVFPFGSLANLYYPDKHIHPTQLYSAALMFIFFIILFFSYRLKKSDGQVFWWGIIFYAIYRFAVEFLRYSPLHWLGLTPSQWLVLAAALVAVKYLLRRQ